MNNHTPQTTVLQEQGIYLVLLAILAVTLLTVIGLGVDAGRLYLTGLDQQRAADAGAISSAYFIGSNLTDPAQTADPTGEIQQIALNIAQDNFEQNRVSFDPANLASHFLAEVNLTERRVRVRTDSTPESFFMGPIVKGERFNLVNTDATAVRQNVAVVLVFDVTGSMNQPVLGTPLRKIDLAVQAAQNFTNAFNQSDRLGLVTFSNTVTLQYSVRNNLNAAQINNYLAVVRNRATGTTNLSLGLMAGWYDMRGLDRVLFPNRVIVLVTDGTPNRNAEDQWAGPFRTSPDITYDVSNTRNLDNNSFPGFNRRPRANPCTGNGPGENQVNRHNFVDTMNIADQIRQDGIRLVTVAIGPSAPNISATNPWGTTETNNAGFIRENFMRWLANDQEGATDNNDIGFPTQCARDYNTMNTDPRFPNYPQGIGLVDQNMQNIDGQLQTVASYLTLQLVE